MDIIEFLEKDHFRLRKALGKIGQSLSQKTVKDQIKLYISFHELHESIEEEMLFPVVSSAMEDQSEYEALLGFEEGHTEIWAQLEKLMDSLATNQVSTVQDAFNKLSAVLKAHMAQEERVLFPAIKRLLQQKILDELGERALRKCERFSMT